MLITHKVALDMLTPGTAPRIQVKQGDTLSRNVEVELLANGEPWEIPASAAPVIRYFAHDPDTGEVTQGIYDTLPSGQPAWRFDGNVIQFIPVPDMLARPGIVQADMAFVVAGETIATFNIEFYVNRAPVDGTDPQVQDYYRVVTLDQINAMLAELHSDVTYALHEIHFIEAQLGLVSETGTT